MKRKLFTILSVVSLLFAAAVTALWVRSYWVCDEVGYSEATANISPIGLTTQPGALVFFARHHSLRLVWGEPWNGFSYRSETATLYGERKSSTSEDVYWDHWGFCFYNDDKVWHANRMAPHGWYLQFPLWFVVLLFLLMPLSWLWSRRRLLRAGQLRRRGLCASCGYDLRASTGNCPECGASIPAKTA